jgi:hypothetical protein
LECADLTALFQALESAPQLTLQSGVKPPHSKMNIPSNWFETFFHGVTLDLWRKAIPPSQTNAEAEFLAVHLNCQPGAHVLDV